MLFWTAVFLSVALITGVFAFGGFAGAAAGSARVLFDVFAILAALSLALLYWNSRS